MKRHIIAILILLIGISTTVSAKLLSSAALLTAESFVAAIDNGDFLKAYSSASPDLQLLKPEKQWIDEQSLTFQLLGKPLHRRLMTVDARDIYPGLPDGNYLLVSYQTTTEHKAKAIEVLLLKEKGEEWMVCKYSIR
ncbi:MAG: DUF4019 domain-containing protein [Desulfuromusa sp.]|jgi:hypothetical protein|nr:DUF4019 domain-containing protein [Desulfuromusa sp.]